MLKDREITAAELREIGEALSMLGDWCAAPNVMVSRLYRMAGRASAANPEKAARLRQMATDMICQAQNLEADNGYLAVIPIGPEPAQRRSTTP